MYNLNFHLMKRFLVLASFYALISQIHSYGCRQVYTADSTMNVREVVVSSKSALRKTSPSQMMTSVQIEKLSSDNVADALRYFSGVQVKDYGGVGGLKTVNIRSLGSQHLGISYDGILIGNAQNGQIDLGQFSVDNIEELSLFNGQKNSIFLPASDFGNAGTVYIRSRRPTFSFDKKNNLRLKLKVSSYDTYRFSAFYEQSLTDILTTSLSAEVLTSSGEYKFRYRSAAYDTTAVRKNGDIEALRAEANFYLSTQNGVDGSFKLYTYHSERGIPGAIASNVWARGERQWDHNSFIQGNIQKSFGNRFTSRLMAKYAYYNTRYVNNDTTRLIIDNNYKQQEFFVSSSNVFELNDFWTTSFSYDFKWNMLDANLNNFAYPHRYSNFVSIASAIDLNHLKIQGSVLATFVNDHTNKNARNDAESAFTPSLFVSWQPVSNAPFVIRAFAKKSFRMPTFNDLYYVDVGNASLKPETAIQYNIGACYDKHWQNGLMKFLKIQTDVYYNTVNDKIIAYPKGSQFRWTMLNLGKVRIHGLDAVAETSLCPSKHLTISTRLQYTWQHAIDATSASTSYYKDQLPYTPRHSGSGLFSVCYRNTEFNLSVLYTGQRYSLQENIERNRMDAWYVCDCSLSHKFHISKSVMRVVAEVNNLFNKEYDIVRNFPMPLRNYSIGITYEL